MVTLADCSDMTIAVYHGHKTTTITKTNKIVEFANSVDPLEVAHKIYTVWLLVFKFSI